MTALTVLGVSAAVYLAVYIVTWIIFDCIEDMRWNKEHGL